MHSRMIDLSRTAACWRDAQPDAAPDDLDASRGILTGMLVSAVMWAGVGLIVLAVLS